MADEVQVVDYRAKYEKLLRETIKEFQTSVRTAQLRAEENSRVSQQNMSELTEQLRRSEKTVQDLQQLLEETRRRLSSTEEQLLQQQTEQTSLDEILIQKRVEFLENLCCLTVEVKRENNQVTYHCTLDDGCLMGHGFELRLDQEKWEYMYTSLSPAQCLPADSDLRKTFWFPDYMMPRFLMKLLSETYKNTDTQIP